MELVLIIFIFLPIVLLAFSSLFNPLLLTSPQALGRGVVGWGGQCIPFQKKQTTATTTPTHLFLSTGEISFSQAVSRVSSTHIHTRTHTHTGATPHSPRKPHLETLPERDKKGLRGGVFRSHTFGASKWSPWEAELHSGES